MVVINGIDAFAELNIKATTVTVGSFDGVHSGHSSLLETLCSSARSEGRKSVVVSFSPHPRVALGRSEGLALLTSDEEKAKLLKDKGVDFLLLLEFNKEFSSLSYEEFIVSYLIKRAKMRELVVGFNHHMGHNGGNFDSIAKCANQYDFKVTLSEEYNADGKKVSSTVIRNAIMSGDMQFANSLLSHPYMMIGQCDNAGQVHSPEPLKLIPPQGQYLANVNSVMQNIEITQSQQVISQERDKQVEIEFISRI